MLEVSDLSVRLGLSEILDQVSLSVERGEIISLMGRNGMGKTTTLRTVMGLESPWNGLVRFEGIAISDWSSWKIARAGIGYVPEGRQIFPNLTVRENLVATARQGNGDGWNEAAVCDLFPRLKERYSNMGDQLSGGEQQMLAIGRALLTNPKLLVLDEATEGLAPILRQEIWESLERLKAMGQSILIVDKNVKDLLRIANRHYVMQKGRIVWSGDSETFRTDTSVVRQYLSV